MADMTRDEDKELRARAIDPGAWSMFDAGMSEAHWRFSRAASLAKAEATMKAEADAGLVVVQYGATKTMQNAACSNFNRIAGLNDAIEAGDLLREK